MTNPTPAPTPVASKVAAIDYWQLVKDFSPGDLVQRVLPGQGVTPYAGRVQNVLRGIGFVDVQWPFGSERVSPEELIRVHPQFGTFLPPALDFSYFPGLDVKKAANTPWRLAHELPPGFHKELARVFHRDAGEMQAYDELWHRYASLTDDEAIKSEIGTFYLFASNSFDLLIKQLADKKTAAYWTSQNRQYRATRSEIQARRPNCPRCGSPMRKTTYKMAEGTKMRLFACPQDLYLIKQQDVVGPGGEEVGW